MDYTSTAMAQAVSIQAAGTLTREAIRNGTYLDAFRARPGPPCWSEAQIDASMQAALAQQPQPAPVWLFAYGSLIWNPLIHVEERQPAVLQHWHRSFCIRLISGRASNELPGRMLALRAGGSTKGIALKLDSATLHDELRLVWRREMVHGLYHPIWGNARLANGQTVSALAFAADPLVSRPYFEADDSIATAAPIIAAATGHLGSNRDYLMQLDTALAAHGIRDDYITELAAAVRALP